MSGAQLPEDLERARDLLGVDEKWLQPFAAGDPFNDGQEVEGFLSRKPDHHYGALAILRVGGTAAPQAVPATPKLRYPFDRAGTFRFPPVKRLVLREKLDGTNVLAYRYHDGVGATFVTYKLRLAPFLRNGRWGDFLDFWWELLERYPSIPELVDRNDCHLSFEMYGSRNVHLVEYQAALDTAVLFGVDAGWKLVPIERLELMGVPAAAKLGELNAGEDPVERYAALRAEIENRNRAVEDGRIVGMEGAVWCVEAQDGSVSLLKCKPESVEAIHWATGINKAAVLATCRNLLETQDELTFETLEPLLLEEYGEKEIEGFRPHVEDCIRQVRAEVEYIERVLAAYAATGKSIDTQKAEVMRELSQCFPRGEMKKVYSTIVRNARSREPEAVVTKGGHGGHSRTDVDAARQRPVERKPELALGVEVPTT
jgi:hypothetical protein